MKLKQEFISHTVEGETLLVPVGGSEFNGIVRGNKTFGAILEVLKNDTGEDAIIAALCARYDAPEAVIAADVHRALSELRRIGALDE